MQYHDYILNMLPNMKDLEEEEYEKKITIVAYLGVCINMWNGPKSFRVNSKKPGIARHLAERYDHEVRTPAVPLPCTSASLAS